MRNRRYVMRRGPLIVIDDNEEDTKVTRAARNIPGVDVAHVERLNLLDLAPGGHLGRFIIWTESAFKQLDNVFGTYKRDGVQKKGYRLQRNLTATADLSRWINSDQVQNVLRAQKTHHVIHSRKVNPLNNKTVMNRLNPFHAKKVAADQKAQDAAAAKRAQTKKAKRNSKAGKERRTASKKFIADVNDAQVKKHDEDEKAYYDEIEAQKLQSSSDEESDEGDE